MARNFKRDGVNPYQLGEGEHAAREFIAAQGPLAATRDDFWRMIWQCACRTVVCLTRCVEKGRDKCHQYWPDAVGDTAVYGDIQVTLTEETKQHELIFRQLAVTHLLTSGAAPRTVHHMHYVGWPDFGVPDTPRVILALVRAFRMRVPPPAGANHQQQPPTLVHCSAGVGRSGTLIALDRLLHVIRTRAHDPIDVFGVVYQLRKHRVLMVQTEQQYSFIHHCLLCALEGGGIVEDESDTSAPSSDRLCSPRESPFATFRTPSTPAAAKQPPPPGDLSARSGGGVPSGTASGSGTGQHNCLSPHMSAPPGIQRQGQTESATEPEE